MAKTDIQLAMEHVCSRIETANWPAYPDWVPEQADSRNPILFRVFFTGLRAPLEYSFGGDYDWSDCGIEVEAVAVGADTLYTTLWDAAQAVHGALQNTSAAPTGGTIYDCALAMPFQQADPDGGSDIKRVGATYAVKAKAT